MKSPEFFHFAGSRHVTSNRPFNGLLHFIPQPEDRMRDKSEPAPAYRQISLYHEALQYIRKHYMDDLSKPSLAGALNVSVRTLTRAFEDRPVEIGDFIHKLKLDKARELLYTTDRAVEDISRELNFSCPKYFSNSYREHLFESPTEFRLRHGAGEE